MALLASAAPAPLPQSTPAANTPFNYAPIALKFVGGPASYTLSLAADGKRYTTNVADSECPFLKPYRSHKLTPLSGSRLSISQIQSVASRTISGKGGSYTIEEFDPSACVYETVNGAPITIVRNSAQQITVGPPQPILAVTCRPQQAQNTCVETNGDCATGGSPVFGRVYFTCCPGNICAATKCRSTGNLAYGGS